MPKTITTKHRLVFFGSDNASALILEDLIKSKELEVIAVVTQPKKAHTHRHQQITRVAQIASQHQIRCFSPQKLTEIVDEIKSLQPTAGVLFSYGKILPDNILEIFPKGIVNIHPSLLPKHRGPSPLESTILAGDTKAGTSIMIINDEMDAGPILAQRSFALETDASKELLWNKLLSVSREIFLPTLLRYLAGTITPQPQTTDISPSYSRIIKKSDGDIDIKTITAQQLSRIIRAYANWPGVRIPVLLRDKPASLTLHEIKLTKSNTSKTAKIWCENHRLFLCLPDASVEIIRAQFPGKKIVSGRDVCNAGDIKLV